MLLLFETAAGFALFKVLKEKKLEEAEVSVSLVLALARGSECATADGGGRLASTGPRQRLRDP